MRPVTLTISGITSWRDKTTISFAGKDLFAVVGPTGSGKSSVLDALTLALYGRAARATAPAMMSRGASAAETTLVFSVGNVEYQVSRSWKQTGSGVKSSVLLSRYVENDRWVPLADSVRGVDTAVGEILRLDFDQFTRVCVLPQGKVAEALQAAPAERDALLSQLLGMDSVGEYREVATVRMRDAEATVTQVRARLEITTAEIQKFEGVDLAERALQLATTIHSLEDVVRSVTELGVVGRELKRRWDDCTLDRGTLPVAPDGIRDLAKRLRESTDAVERAQEQVRNAHIEETRARSDLADVHGKYGTRTQLETWMADWKHLKVLRDRHATLTEDIAEVTSRAELARVALSQATTDLEQATIALAAAEMADKATAIRDNLSDGDQCPVCANTYHATSVPAGNEAISTAREAFTAATERHTAAATTAAETETTLSRLQIEAGYTKDAITEKEATSNFEEAFLTEWTAALFGAENAVTAAAETKAHANHELDAARERQHQVSTTAAETHAAAKTAETTLEGIAARHNFPLTFPAYEDDLENRWANIIDVRNTFETKLDEIRTTLKTKAEATRTKALATLAAANAASVDEVRAHIADTTRELATVELAVTRLDTLTETLTALTEELSRAETTLAVRKSLCQHLTAKYFPRWLLENLTSDLLTLASEHLTVLTSGRYRLVRMLENNNGQIGVLDNYLGTEIRPVSTLSGGETFVAALAFSLALAEVARAGAGVCEALFIDEGFGSLDSDSLDVALDALSTLALTGRMIGVVSHVSDLRERMPAVLNVRSVGGAAQCTWHPPLV